MKYYAVVTDTVRDEPFGLVVRNGSGSVCYGFHAAGSQWADLYNAGEIKTLEEGLPPDIELGHFGPLHFDVEDMLEKSPETIPTPEILTLIESEWLPNNSTGIGLANVPLAGISKKSRQFALDYKAHAFLTDSRHSSLLLTARLSGNKLTTDNSYTRRTAKNLLKTKMLILTQPYRHDDAISEEEIQIKALGRQIGRGARRARRIGRAAGRSAAGFDPDARDADLDMLIQEGTAWERPALPGKPDLPGVPRARTARRAPADRDRSARRMRQGQGLASGRSDAYYQPDDDPEYEKEYERQWDRFRSAMQDWTLAELTDELPQDGWSKLQDFTSTLDENELDAQLDKPIRDLPEAWQKAIRDLSEAAFNGDPDALMEMDGLRRGPGPPDPYDVAKDRRDRGLASSRSDAYYQPDDDPEYEKEYERQWDRFRSAMQDWTLAELTDELPQDGWSKLQDFTSTLDENELDAQLDKPIRDLPEAWQKAIRDLSEAAFNGDPDALMDKDWLHGGPGPPDPYDVQQERRMEGLASRREGLRSFREFDRRVRETSPKERERASREASEEWERIVQALMGDDGTLPERWSGLSRPEAIEQIRKLAGIDRVFGQSDLSGLREMVAKKHRSSYGLRSQRDPGMNINMDWDIRDPDDRRDWHESEMGPGRDAVGKIQTDNVNVEIVSEADVMGEGEGFMVSGYYRDIDGTFGNQAEWFYDLEVFDTPEEAAAWVDSLDRSIDDDVGYDDWNPPERGLASRRGEPMSPSDRREGLRSFREFERAVRENAPYDSPESRRHRREASEEWKRLVQFIMDEHQERADLMARLYPEQSPEDHAPAMRVLSRQEAIEELQRRAGISRILPGGGGIAELRKRTSEKYRADMEQRATAARIAEGGKPIPLQYHTARLTSDEILALENVMEEIRERWERASEALIRDARSNPDVLSRPSPSSISLTGKMSPGDELRIIQDLDDSMWSALDAIRKPFSWKPGPSPTGKDRYYQSGRMQFGNRKRVDDTIDFLQALNASQDEPWDDLSDLIGVLEGVRDGDKGKYESPNLWSGLSSRRRGDDDLQEMTPEEEAELDRTGTVTGGLVDRRGQSRTAEDEAADRDMTVPEYQKWRREERAKWQEEEDALDAEFAQADREGRVTGGLVRREMTSEEEAELDRTGRVTGGRVQRRIPGEEERRRQYRYGFGSRRDDDPRDPDDWREIEEELSRLRTHPGAPSEENPGGTQEYWNQPWPGRENDPGGPQTLGEENIGFRRDSLKEPSRSRTQEYWNQPLPGRENDPGGPQTLGEENIGFRRDGLHSSRGSNDPYDPRNDPPPMVRPMRSDGTPGPAEVDPDWLERHPEGVQGWLDKHDPDDGPESRYAQDPDNWRETQAEIHDWTDQRIEESLNRMTDEMRQEEFTRGTELEDAARQALEDIEWGRNEGFRSYLDRHAAFTEFGDAVLGREDFDPDRDIDPDLHHDDPFIRDQKLNESIFNDRMAPMTFDAVADKYDMDRVEIRRREQEHMDLLSGQERYAAQPDLNRRIFEDRVGFRMTIEEVAEKYDIDRAEVRMREITHAHGRSSQEKFYAQPNLNRRIAESRMRGMSLDEVAERFNMDPEEVRFREVTYLGTSPEMFQYAEDAERDPGGTGGFRSVRTPEAPVVDQAGVTALNRQIDTLRDGKIKPLFKRIAAALEEGDDKAVHRLRKQVRPHQEEEAELREQLGEAMGKGRVAFGYRSSRATDDWDADWKAAREEAETEITELAEKIGIERGRKKPNKKRINELAQQQLAVIEKARERGLRAPSDGAPWSDPERSAVRRATSQRFWSQGGEISDAERHSIGRGGFRSERDPSRARMRTTTTQRAARPLGLASRRKRHADTMETLPTIYRGDSPRQAGTADGEIWDSLTDAAGVMPPAHAKAIEAAAEQLEVELMSGRTDLSKQPRGGSYDAGLAGGNKNQHETYEEAFAGGTGDEGVRDAMIASGHITDDDDTPPVAEWRLEQIGGRDETAGARAFENIIGDQLVKRTGTVGQAAITKRKLLDSLQVLQYMRGTGNYEALEHLHPEARRRLLEIARSKDQTFPEKIKGVTASGRGGKNSTFWSELGGHDSVDEFKRATKGRSRRFREKPKGRGSKDPFLREGGEKPTLRARLGEAMMAPGSPARFRKRQEALRRQQAAAQAGGAGTGGVGPVKSEKPWDKKLSIAEQFELAQAKRRAKKTGKLNSKERLGRIRENRSTGARDVEKPLSGAAAITEFAGTKDDLQQWEKAEGALIVDKTFIDRLARLTRVRTGEVKKGDKPKTRADARRKRDDIVDASQFHAGHNGVPEMVGPEEIQDVVFEPDPDQPGRFRLREGFKPLGRGMGRGGEGKQGEVYWEQWVRLISRFVGGRGGEFHAAGENNAEPPVRILKPDGSLTAPTKKGNMFGGFGTGTLSFITPETRLVGWGKLARINDEAEAIVKVLGAGREGGALHDVSLSGLADALTPITGLKDSGTSGDFATAVRGALDAAEKAAGGRLKVRTRKNPRRAQDPSKAFEEGGTSTGYGVYGHGGGEQPMGAGWRDTEFGSIVDQVLDLHESGDIGTDQVEKAWEFLMRMPASVHDPKGGSTGATRADHFLYDTLPIYGYDAVQRHGGVVSVSNRAALMVLDHPVTGDEITKIIESLAKEGRLDQDRLLELIPDYGRYQ